MASLDLLRLAACAAVLVAHGRFYMTPGMRPLGDAASDLWLHLLAVEVFFVLSGFLITRILLRDRAGGSPWRYFFARRALRIMPAYFLLMVPTWYACQYWPWFFGNKTMHWSSLLYGLNIWQLWVEFRIGNYDVFRHVWSLCVEEQFYFVWPLMVLFLPRDSARRVLIYVGFPLAVLVALCYTDHPEAHRMTYQHPIVRIASLGAGAMLAYHEAWARSPNSRTLALMLIPFGMMIYRPIMALTGTPLPAVAYVVGRAALATGIVLFSLSVFEPWIRRSARWLAHPAMAEAGMMSYGIYLYHMLAFLIVERSRGGQWYTFPAQVLLTLGIAWLSYRYFERPLLQWAGRRFRVQPQQQQPLRQPVPHIVSALEPTDGTLPAERMPSSGHREEAASGAPALTSNLS